MCSITGPFKLCTCGSEIDTSKPHWRLRIHRLPDRMDTMVIGQSYPFIYSDMKRPLEDLILDKLNNETVFDFAYTPGRGDILELNFPEEGFFVFKFKKGAWCKLNDYDLGDNLKRFEEELRGGFVHND